MGQDGRPTGRVSAKDALAVWTAEDGRCEACGRPLDRRCTAFTRVDHTRRDWSPANLHLLCPDCDKRRPDLLATVVLAGEVAERVVGSSVRSRPPRRRGGWWRSCAATGCWCGPPRRGGRTGCPASAPSGSSGEDGSAAVVAVERLADTPQLQVKPQARTRGLPRPDRGPLPDPAPAPRPHPDNRCRRTSAGGARERRGQRDHRRPHGAGTAAAGRHPRRLWRQSRPSGVSGVAGAASLVAV